jgi:hypothetical protein
MRRFIYTLIALVLLHNALYAQKPTQSIHGTVIDKESQSPLPGVTVIILNMDSLVGTTTDVNGRYSIHNIPIGRVNVQFTFMGYKPFVLNNVVLDAGKEGLANASLEESIDSLNEVVIKATRPKNTALNEMSTVSARQFSPDDASRYAGSLGDPSRMATNFAGVGNPDDTRNDIVIRGNSPLGLLWKLDGVDIPNPNHFGTLGSTGGPVSILNNNMLDNSDFMTGAFPAEYGNATAGVFDLKLKTGNSEQSEYTGQVGFNGFELEAEGPFSKNSSASYIVDARYSCLVFFNLLGINFGYAAIPQYSDVSFKVNVPTDKFGCFSVFGIGGPSWIDLLAKDLSKDNYSLSPFNEDTHFASNMGVVGATNKYFFNEKTSQTISFAVTGIQNVVKIDTNYNNGDQKITYGQNSLDLTYILSYTLNTKVDARNTVRMGTSLDFLHSNYADSSVLGNGSYQYNTKFNGTNPLYQAYIEWQHKFTDNIVMNGGLHYQEFFLSHSTALEPRLGFKWHFTEKQDVGIAVGMHSELQPMYVYYYSNQLNNGSYQLTNTNLGFSKSDHIVLSYDNAFAPNWRVKLETYYQYLYNIPIQQYPSTYSAINLGASYYDNPVDSLVNKGTGQNYGVELTLEKFFNKDYYILFTGSLYNSFYTPSDGHQYNTAFNGNYIVNLLGGGDISLDKAKKHVITVSIKANFAGGKRYIPVDLPASQAAGYEILDNSQTFTQKYADYSRIDVQIGFKLNGKKVTHEWDFQAQNVLNRANIFQQLYNPETNNIETDYQLGFFPLGMYKITF